MTLGRCPLNIFCSRGTLDLSITGEKGIHTPDSSEFRTWLWPISGENHRRCSLLARQRTLSTYEALAPFHDLNPKASARSSPQPTFSPGAGWECTATPPWLTPSLAVQPTRQEEEGFRETRLSQTGHDLKGFNDFSLKANARIWP